MTAWASYLEQAARQRREAHRWRARHIHHDEDVIDFASNDYLGLASDPRLAEAEAEGARRYGTGSRASHLVNGHLEIHEALEEALANLTGRPRALLFSTGYMANLGTLQALCGPDTHIFQDRLNHASLLDGASLSGARSRRFHHQDIDDLDRLLQRAPMDTRKMIVSDGVFSMDGDQADIAGLTTTARRHSAWLMVDDAHGLGVLGEHGSGCVGQRHGTEHVQVLVGTLGKALGTAGAFVAGDSHLIDHLIQFARPYIYTTAMPPGVAAATMEAVRICTHEPQLRERLQHLTREFRRRANDLGLSLLPSSTPIQPVLLGDEARALRWGDWLAQAGIKVGVIRPPTVPQGESRLRITLSARHSDAQLDHLLNTLAACLHKEAA